jgi:hypothetical protein
MAVTVDMTSVMRVTGTVDTISVMPGRARHSAGHGHGASHGHAGDHGHRDPRFTRPRGRPWSIAHTAFAHVAALCCSAYAWASAPAASCSAACLGGPTLLIAAVAGGVLFEALLVRPSGIRCSSLPANPRSRWKAPSPAKQRRSATSTETVRD